MRRISTGIACVLFSIIANADVLHTENANIAGGTEGSSIAVCFNNDGLVADVSECTNLSSPIDEGYVFVSIADGLWKGGAYSGINWCGTVAVNPVTSAICPYTTTSFANCTSNGRVLVQTTKSDHYWSVKANADCSGLATPETNAVQPCLVTDAFDPLTGCTALGNQNSISVEGGYLKLATFDGAQPPNGHCAVSSHYGRMAIDSKYGHVYVCTDSGWELH